MDGKRERKRVEGNGERWKRKEEKKGIRREQAHVKWTTRVQKKKRITRKRKG